MKLFFLSLLGTLVTAGSPLSVLINVGLSSKSHISGILKIASEMQQRGHNIHYAASTSYLNYARGYNYTVHELPNVSIENLKGTMKIFGNLLKSKRGLEPLNIQGEKDGLFYNEYKIVFNSISQLFNESHFDLVVCDFNSLACQDAALASNIPMIIGIQSLWNPGFFQLPYMSSNFEFGPNSLESMSFIERVKDFLAGDKMNDRLYEIQLEGVNQARKELGIRTQKKLFESFNTNLVLSVSFTGFEPAIHNPPNVRLVGPFKFELQQGLTPEVKTFLESRKKIVYVGFGSITKLLPEDQNDILKSLNLLLEKKEIDGVIWGLGQSKLEYNLNPNILALAWAPQNAILNHKKTKLFISHCGMESILESTYALKPILCLPFFGDQPANAAKVKEFGTGSYVSRRESTPEKLVDLAKSLLLDSTKSIHQNLIRLKTIAELRSKQSLNEGSNIMEEMAHTAHACRPYQSDNELPCEIRHLIPASVNMPWYQAQLLDVYLFLAIMGLTGLYFIFYIVFKLITLIQFKAVKVKSE